MSTNAIAERPHGATMMAPRGHTTIAPAAPMDVMQIGKVFAASGFFQDTKSEAQAIVKILAGQEIGLGPMAAMQGIHIIKGKPSFSGNLMASLIKRSGVYSYRIREHTDTVCRIEFYERTGRAHNDVESLGTAEFTIEDAKRAGLMANDNWKHYPRNMLFNRAISNGFKMFCPELSSGMPAYTPEELGADVNEDGEPTAQFRAQAIDVTPEPDRSRQAQPAQDAPRELSPLQMVTAAFREYTADGKHTPDEFSKLCRDQFGKAPRDEGWTTEVARQLCQVVALPPDHAQALYDEGEKNLLTRAELTFLVGDLVDGATPEECTPRQAAEVIATLRAMTNKDLETVRQRAATDAGDPPWVQAGFNSPDQQD